MEIEKSAKQIKTSSDVGSPTILFEVLAEFGNARKSNLHLPHGTVETPVFMPVGTKGSLKGLTSEELELLGCRLFLGNTYHLHNDPGADFFAARGGLHSFIGWKHNLLTDSGGFQMVSLSKFCSVDDEAVSFQHPNTHQKMSLRPEDSIKAQTGIGADIIMALDDVVSSVVTGPRVLEACDRTISWIHRCISAHKNHKHQNLFPIVQGGLDTELRKKCLESFKQLLDVPGFAIGGLSGGENKMDFVRIVAQCCNSLPKSKPRYLMGVGFPVDILVCSLLGVDMFDCVYATRTARFGTAMTDEGIIKLKNKEFEADFMPIMKDCRCEACCNYTRAFLHTIVCKQELSCHLLTKHNISYLFRLTNRIKQAINNKNTGEFANEYLKNFYGKEPLPEWVIYGLTLAGISI